MMTEFVATFKPRQINIARFPEKILIDQSFAVINTSNTRNMGTLVYNTNITIMECATARTMRTRSVGLWQEMAAMLTVITGVDHLELRVVGERSRELVARPE